LLLLLLLLLLWQLLSFLSMLARVPVIPVDLPACLCSCRISMRRSVAFTEMAFLDISLTKKLEPFAPCYSQSLLLADFKKTTFFVGIKLLTKNLLNKRTRVYS
jgi:hypothetical protein